MNNFSLIQIGIVRSEIKERSQSPRQGYYGAPDVWIEIHQQFGEGLKSLKKDMDIILVTWLHEALRDVLQVRKGKNPDNPITGVFNTRSPDRPNPIGLHRVKIFQIDGTRLRVGPLEVIDGTPIIDIKSVLMKSNDS